MGQFDSRNTPVLAANDGFQSEPLANAAGPTLLVDLCAVPNGANGAWIQVPAGENLEFRIDGDDAGADFMTLPGLTVLPLTNRRQLLSLVLRSPAGTTTVNVQFYMGSVGPMPPAPEINSTTSVTPPPPPGGAALFTTNVVHVMKPDGAFGGNDATGTRNRLDLPFLTITAAQAVALPGDLIKVWPGVYDEGELGVEGVTFDLVAAVITATAPFTSIFTTVGGLSYEVTGMGVLDFQGTGSCVNALDGGYINIAASVGSADIGLNVENGSTLNLTGGVQAGMVAAKCGEGVLTTTGSVRSLGSYGAWTSHPDADMRIGGDAISEADYGAVADFGTQYVAGKAIVTVSGSGNAAYCGDAVQRVVGGAFNYGTGTATSTTVANGEQVVDGPCYSAGAVACRSTAGKTTVMGAISCDGGRGILVQGGEIIANGYVTSAIQEAAGLDGGQLTLVAGGAGAAGFETVQITDAASTLILEGGAYLGSTLAFPSPADSVSDPSSTGADVFSRGAGGVGAIAATLNAPNAGGYTSAWQ